MRSKDLAMCRLVDGTFVDGASHACACRDGFQSAPQAMVRLSAPVPGTTRVMQIRRTPLLISDEKRLCKADGCDLLRI